MAPLIVLTIVTLVLLAAGAAGVRRLRPWPVAVRGGLTAMFILTGVSHFVGMRADLINMVPPALPEPALLVTLTGVLELAGAAGLSALLVGMFPANVYAATADLTVGGAPAEDLLPRTLMQLVFLAATLSVLAYYRGSRRPAANAKPSAIIGAR